MNTLITLLSFIFLFSNLAFADNCKPFYAQILHKNGTRSTYNTIRKALDDVKNNEKIIVGKDTNEKIVIYGKNKVELIGRCNNRLRGIKIIASKNIKIKGFDIQKSDRKGSCINLVYQKQGQKIKDITIVENKIHSCGADIGGQGIRIGQESEDIIIKRNQIFQNASNGILIHPFSTVTLIENEITNNGKYGLKRARLDEDSVAKNIKLVRNKFLNNNGRVRDGISSNDLFKYSSILDKTDKDNTTTTNSEGLGIGGEREVVIFPNAGLDRTVDIGNIVTLDGSQSSTILEGRLLYNWSLISAPENSQVTLEDSNKPLARFTVDLAGDYLFQLEVTSAEDSAQKEIATVQISTQNSKPVASFQAQGKLAIGTLMNLNASLSSDDDSDALTYEWELFEKPQASNTLLSNSNQISTSFTPDIAGEYSISLIVRDGVSESEKKVITLSTTNTDPQISVKDIQDKFKNEVFDLDASSTLDLDSDALSYSWSTVFSEENPSLINNTAAIANTKLENQGLSIFNVVVDDGTKKVSKTISVNIVNRAPVARIEGLEIAETLVSIPFSASMSFDEDGDSLSYNWELVEKPQDSQSSFTDSNSVNTTLVPDKSGTYKIRLTVSDTEGSFSIIERELRTSFRPVAIIASEGDNLLGSETLVDASASTDADNDSLTYSWSLITSPEDSFANLGAGTNERSSFVADKEGRYTIELIVSDGVLNSLPSTIDIDIITKSNNPPRFIDSSTHLVVNIGQELKYRFIAEDMDESDNLIFRVSPSTPLAKNMKFFGSTGEFSFKPSLDQVGDYSLDITLSDEFTSVAKSITISVVQPILTGETTFSGIVYDANSQSEGVAIPVVGAKVSMLGTEVEAITDINGRFLLENLPSAQGVFSINTDSALLSPEGNKYANFIEQIVFIEGVDNIEQRAFYLPHVESLSLTDVIADQPTDVFNFRLGVGIKIPENEVKNPDGTSFNGQLSISAVPRNLAPVVLPERFNPGLLLTIQPSGVRFDNPVPITYPNIDELAPGSIVDIMQVIEESGRFELVGKGKVTADGKLIETIEGGMISASWSFPAPPVTVAPVEDPQENNCLSCKEAVGSSVDLSSGTLFNEYEITSYFSMGQRRSFKLIYASNTAKPFFNFKPRLNLLDPNSRPPLISTQLFIEGAEVSEKEFMDISELSIDENYEIVNPVEFDADHLKSGIYRNDILIGSHFPASEIFQRASDNAQYKGDFAVINLIDSPYGAGWDIDILHRIFENTRGDILLTFNGGSSITFKLNEDNSYTSSREDFSVLTKLEDGSFKRRMRNGDTYHFDQNGFLQVMIDRNSNETAFHYNEFDAVKSITDPTGLKTEFIYDANNKLSKIIDPASRETLITVDQNNDLTRITYPDENYRSYNYGDDHLILGKAELEQNLTKKMFEFHSTFTYKFVERCKRTPVLNRVSAYVRSQPIAALNDKMPERVAQDPSYSLDVLTKESLSFEEVCKTTRDRVPKPVILDYDELFSDFPDKNGNITKKILNQSGFTTLIEDPLGRRTELIRNDANQVVFRRDAAGRIIRTLYDTRGNLTRRIGDGEDIQIFYDDTFSRPVKIIDDGDITLLTLDDRGNTIEIKDPKGRRTFIDYNNRGQITKIIDSKGNQTLLSYNSKGNISTLINEKGDRSSFEYDLAGNIIKYTDFRGHITSLVYDVKNRVTEVTNPNQETTQFTYDSRGNVLTVIDAKNNKTSFIYSGDDKVIQRTDPEGKVESYNYDPQGNLLVKSDKRDLITFYKYNEANELTEINYPSGRKATLFYDQSGFLRNVGDLNSQLSFFYNAESQLSSSSTAGSPFQPEVNLAYTYEKGNRTLLETPEGNISYFYNKLDQLERIRTLSGRDISFEFNQINQRNKVTLPNTLITSMNYDRLNRLQEINHKDDLKISYGHDENSNRNSMSVVRNITGIIPQINYVYDDSNQLISANKTLSDLEDEIFSWDDLGNRNTQTVDQNNEIQEDENYFYVHDDMGQLTQKTNKLTQEVTKYIWDLDDRLVKITTHTSLNAPESSVVEYRYDVLGRRISKIINGVETNYVYDGSNILFEYEGGVLKTKWTHGDGIDEPLEMNRDNNNYYYHRDGLGSIVALSNEAGELVEQYSYTSFGEMRTFDGTGAEIVSPQIGNLYGFTGREFDRESDLYYYRARYYSPETGRFISEDPIGFNGGDSNLYRYVNNNPLKYTDPLGLMACTDGPNGGSTAFDPRTSNDAIDNSFPILSLIVVTRVGQIGISLIPKRPIFDKVMNDINNSKKLSSQMRKRNITPESIERALKQKPIDAQGKINPAKRFVDPETGNSITIDSVTGQPFQVAPGSFKF